MAVSSAEKTTTPKTSTSVSPPIAQPRIKNDSSSLIHQVRQMEENSVLQDQAKLDLIRMMVHRSAAVIEYQNYLVYDRVRTHLQLNNAKLRSQFGPSPIIVEVFSLINGQKMRNIRTRTAFQSGEKRTHSLQDLVGLAEMVSKREIESVALVRIVREQLAHVLPSNHCTEPSGTTKKRVDDQRKRLRTLRDSGRHLRDTVGRAISRWHEQLWDRVQALGLDLTTEDLKQAG